MYSMFFIERKIKFYNCLNKHKIDEEQVSDGWKQQQQHNSTDTRKKEEKTKQLN